MTTEDTCAPVQGDDSSKNVVDSCANCGKSSECDDVKLSNCTDCYLAKYCSVGCQKTHRSEHKPACKLGAKEIKERSNFKAMGLSASARKLRSEVIALKVTALPMPTRNREEKQAKVDQLRMLYKKVEAYETLLEDERLEAALRVHEEKFPRPTVECPLCLGDIKYTISVHEMRYFNCCSNVSDRGGLLSALSGLTFDSIPSSRSVMIAATG